MIVNYTAEEQAKWEALEDKYEKLINEINEQIRGSATAETYKEKEKEILKRRSLAEPYHLHPKLIGVDENGNAKYDEKELEQYYNSEEYKAYKKALEDTRKELTEFYSSFTPYSENEFTELKRKRAALIDEHARARQQLYEECEQRQFNELGGDPVKIIEDAKSQVEQVINNRYIAAIKYKEEGAVFSERYLRVDGDKLLIDTDSMIEDCRSILSLHYKALEEDQEATEALIESISDVIINNPYTGDTGTLGGFVNDHIKSKKTYRIRTREEKAEATADIPKGLANITFKSYQYGMSWHEEGKAYLQKLYTTDGLKFKNGKMYFDDAFMGEVSEVELQNMKTKEGIASIDLTFLRAIYSIILQRFINNGNKLSKEVLSYNISDIAEYTGGQTNLNKADTKHLIEKLQSYHNIIGVLHGVRNGQPVQSLYPVLNFEGYNDTTKKISFNSPYMNYVIETVYNASIVKNVKGIAQKDRQGKLLTTAAYSWSEKGSLVKARNKTAAANVEIIVRLIEQCGDNEPHIKASTLIERNELFSQRLASDKNTTKFLERVFINTWEYLRKYTDLEDRYKNIQLPDPKDPKNIPSIKDLDRVFTFKHEGKISKK